MNEANLEVDGVDGRGLGLDAAYWHGTWVGAIVGAARTIPTSVPGPPVITLAGRQCDDAPPGGQPDRTARNKVLERHPTVMGTDEPGEAGED